MLGLLLLVCSGASTAIAQQRYIAETVSGSRFDGKELHDWHDVRAQPRIDARKLFDEPLRFVLDTAAPPAGPVEAYIEIFGGDCLPGRVIGSSEGQDTIGERFAPHILVEPSIAADSTEMPRAGGLRVATRWLKRVVWQRRGDPRYRPGTLFYKDGRQVEFRSLRWGHDSVRMLVEDQPRDVPFGQIAEVHFPRADPWEAYLEQLAANCPDGTGSVVQIETSDGLRATVSQDRFRAFRQGGDGREHWRHLVQPAWCDEPLWVRFPTIRAWRYFSPHEVPLTAIEPSRTIYRAALGGGWWPQTDRNVQGGPLQSGSLRAGWGLGVQAYSELEFPLPAFAKTFRSRCGLDIAAGRGGCVKGRVFAGPPEGAPVFETPVVVGTADPLDSGSLVLSFPEKTPRRVTLVVDPVIKERPSGADPFEIRDVFDWHQPLVELDAEPLKADLARRAGRIVPAWTDWTLAAADRNPAQLVNRWDALETNATRFGLLASPRTGALTLSRRWTIPQDARFLLVRINRPEKQVPPSSVQVRIDGRALVEYDVPIRYSHLDPDPVLVPMDAYRGRSVTVEVSHMSSQPQAWVEWRGVSLAAEAPMLRRIFDDEARFADDLVAGDALARLDGDDKQTGFASLAITPGEKSAALLPGLAARIREHPRLGEYRFIRFAWKKSGGGAIRLHLAQDGQWGPVETRDQNATLRYSAGKDKEQVRSISLDGNPPPKWQVVIRDLYQDFGGFQLTGLKLESAGGGTASFDGIYLARRREDFEKLDAKIDDPFLHLSKEEQAQVLLPLHRPADLSRSLIEFAPLFSCSTIGPEGLWLLKDYRGRQKVLRTAPPAADKPCILRAPILVPAGKFAQLRLSVSHRADHAWELEVFANGQSLAKTEVSKATAPNEWLDLTADLTPFAGQNVLVEIHHKGKPGSFGYWSKLEVQ